MRKIQAVTVCVNYSDFLIHCINNKEVFDKWIIVTDTKDNETKQLCDTHGLTCIQTDVFYEGDAPFRKYAGINEGLKHVDKDAWVVFIDGDIILSPHSKRVLQEIPLDDNNIYGIDRLNINDYDNYIKFRDNTTLIRDNWLMTSGGLEFGSRIVHIYGEWGDEGRFTGWKPLGFFQMCKREKFDTYPEGSKDASHGDIAFAKLWSRYNRTLIPEMIGIHINTENYHGNNWQGRKSKPFKPKNILEKVISKL